MIASGGGLAMPDVLVRDVEERVLSKLKSRARKNGRSLQSELLQVFTALTESDSLSDEKTADKIRNALRGRKHSDSAELLREDRRR
ncbi:MAG: Arc family DNA-binding protein [Pyrinomonadaceae bacterium]